MLKLRSIKNAFMSKLATFLWLSGKWATALIFSILSFSFDLIKGSLSVICLVNEETIIGDVIIDKAVDIGTLSIKNWIWISTI